MESINALKEQVTKYVNEKADYIISEMVRRNEMSTTESTCELHWYGWDKQYHMMFPKIAEELRRRGLSVSSKVNFGVTDWYITM